MRVRLGGLTIQTAGLSLMIWIIYSTERENRNGKEKKKKKKKKKRDKRQNESKKKGIEKEGKKRAATKGEAFGKQNEKLHGGPCRLRPE